MKGLLANALRHAGEMRRSHSAKPLLDFMLEEARVRLFRDLWDWQLKSAIMEVNEAGDSTQID
jgi:hypothetical protein